MPARHIRYTCGANGYMIHGELAQTARTPINRNRVRNMRKGCRGASKATSSNACSEEGRMLKSKSKAPAHVSDSPLGV